MAAEPELSNWNYFSYFTEVEEHFQKTRGSGLFLLSPLDWALIETWKNAEIPLEAVLRGFLRQLDRAGERAVVGERDRRHLELGRPRGKRGDPARPVEDRVLAVDVQMDERRGHGRATLLRGEDGFRRAPERPAQGDFRARKTTKSSSAVGARCS